MYLVTERQMKHCDFLSNQIILPLELVLNEINSINKPKQYAEINHILKENIHWT